MNNFMKRIKWPGQNLKKSCDIPLCHQESLEFPQSTKQNVIIEDLTKLPEKQLVYIIDTLSHHSLWLLQDTKDSNAISNSLKALIIKEVSPLTRLSFELAGRA